MSNSYNMQIKTQQENKIILTQKKQQHLLKVTAPNEQPISIKISDKGFTIPYGEIEITKNGVYNVFNYARANVNIVNEDIYEGLLDNTITKVDSNVKSIAGYACRGMSKLKTVNLPNATSIGNYAFYYCTALTSINAPKVTSLGSYTLYNCGAIKSVNFPLVNSIGQNTFYSCGGLERADFGVAGTINQAGFAYCSKLKALILRKTGTICKLATATNAFQGSAIADGTGYVYVPDELVDEYRVATNWVNYASQIRGLSNLDNLLDLSDQSFPMTLDKGLEISYNKADMSITFNGTLTDGGGFNIPLTQNLIGTYTLSYSPAESDKAFYISIDNKTETMVNGWGATEKTFTLTEQPSQLMFWFDHSGTPERNVYDNYTITLKLVKHEGDAQ